MKTPYTETISYLAFIVDCWEELDESEIALKSLLEENPNKHWELRLHSVKENAITGRHNTHEDLKWAMHVLVLQEEVRNKQEALKCYVSRVKGSTEDLRNSLLRIEKNDIH